MDSYPGLLVSIDGPSGVGKTTLCRILGRRLRREGHNVTITSTPSSSQIGKFARFGTKKLRGHTLALLVAADRYLHHQRVIVPALLRGHLVLCDRYIPSSLALDVLDGVNRNYAFNLYRYITLPDLCVILVGDPATSGRRAAHRGRYSRFHYRTLTDLRKELNSFLEAAAFLRQRRCSVKVQSVVNLTPHSIALNLAAAIVSKLRECRI